jgi:hypothetical protein
MAGGEEREMGGVRREKKSYGDITAAERNMCGIVLRVF